MDTKVRIPDHMGGMATSINAEPEGVPPQGPDPGRESPRNPYFI
jgi:hypothetical protein